MWFMNFTCKFIFKENQQKLKLKKKVKKLRDRQKENQQRGKELMDR